MKRILAILLLSIFSLTAVGVEVKKLYCDGQLAKIGADANPCCKSKSCCKVESNFYTLTAKYEQSAFVFDFKSLIASASFIVPPQLVLEFPPVITVSPSVNPPDPGRLYCTVPIRILHCSYQI